MITLIYGSYGCGKTTSVISSIQRDTAAGIHTFLIVPEQDAVQSERRTLDLLPASAQLTLEVLNFSRLYNRACREYGGLSYRYITNPIRHLLMWQNLRELAPLLTEYGALAQADPSSLCDMMLSALNECKANGITADQLEATAQKLSSDDPLRQRLLDLSLIFSAFDRLVSQNYSDSSDDLARLYETLKEHRFFAGANVYIDAFTSFTEMEHRIIERIFAQAENVTVTVPLSHPNANELGTESIRHSLTRLIRSAEMHGGYREVVLRKNYRTTSPTLAYLSENLWRMNVSESQAFSDGSIRMEICDTPYAEVNAVAAHVLELLRSGERCRDIAVLMRDPEKYRGIIDTAFSKSEIPYFFSQKTDFCSLPPIKLLLSALRIKQYHWQKNDVLSHIKTGLYPFPERSIDLFEEYVNTWNLSKNRFTDGDWNMNPDGFTDQCSLRGEEILQHANEIRRKLTEILERFFILLEAAKNVPEQCRCIYQYLQEIGLEEKLRQLAKEELVRGRRKEAKELLSLYGMLLNTLADIAAAMPEEEISTEEFSVILQTVFSQLDIGTIPTSVDEVMIGSAATLRVSNPKYVFVLGLCEGEFPAAINDHGLFSFADRSMLSSLGIELSSDADTRSSEELMYVHRAFSAPSHGLFLSTFVAELNGQVRTQSLPFRRVLALFQNLEPHRYFSEDLRYLTGAPRVAATHLRTLTNKEDAEALKEALISHLSDIASLADSPVTDTECTVAPAHVPLRNGQELRLSSSRFEAYVKCPFNYYCTYVLGLREQKQAHFRTSGMGNFIHYVLEHLLRFAVEHSENGVFPQNELLLQQTELIVEEYITKITPENEKNSRRLRHLYIRLKRLAVLMIQNILEEFSSSDFIPAFFELHIDGKDSNPPPMEFLLSDGFRVSFSGIVDRVDVLKKNGEVYLRIVDYKTGTKLFSLEEIPYGINLQMILYLFALCRTSNSEFAHKLGLSKEQSPTPAGILYLSANLPTVEAEEYDTEEAVLQQATDSFKRSGLLLDDKDILMAMNHELSSKFLAGIKKNKDGELVGKALFSSEAFEDLYRQIETTVERIANALRNGNAEAKPTECPGQDPCAYCHMKPICRRSDR
ncbi:MAG: exodeoxyribonuclease V subunit gamma [Clostridia bacterium]|nr:exodeoxyribonuclease V subunit gamma [Clostridia bacterium]